MSLQIWLPLNGSMKNQGLCGVSTIDQSNGTFVAGKLGQCLHTSTSSINTNLIASKWDYSINSISLAGWFKFNKSEINAILPQSITSSTATTPTGTLIGYNSYGGLALTWRTNNIYNSGALSSFEVAGTLRGSVATSTAWKNLNFDEWYHLCLTFNIDTKKMSLYVNGILFNSYIYSGTINNPTQNCFININNIQGGNGPSRCIPFYLNDVRIYNHCLSAKEVKIISQGLILHYPLNDKRPLANLKKNATYTVYNNFSGSGTTGNLTKLNEKYHGCDIYRLTMIPDSTRVDSFRTGLYDHGIYGFSTTFKANTKYCFWIYYRPVTHLDIRVGGTASNIGGWAEIAPKKYDNEWYIVGQYRTGSVTENKTDNIFTSFYTPTAEANIPISIDFCCPHLVEGSQEILDDGDYQEIVDKSIVYDTSGYCNNGTARGTLVTSNDTSKYNCSTEFNGTDNTILVPYDANIWQTNFTINIWFKKNELGTKNYETLFGGPSGFEMDTRSSSATTLTLFMASARGGNITGNNFSSFNFSEWYMVTLVNDGTNELYYVNGNFIKSITKKSMPVGQYYIGSWNTATSQNYKGLISDFRIYATALSAEDIAELYSVGASIDNQGNIFTYQLEEG